MKTIYGYARVSRKEPHLNRQLRALAEYGVQERDIVSEKESGKSLQLSRKKPHTLSGMGLCALELQEIT